MLLDGQRRNFPPSAAKECDWVANPPDYTPANHGEFDSAMDSFPSSASLSRSPFLFPPPSWQLLYWMTDRGEDIATAQYLFMGVYVSLIMLVLSIYRRAGGSAMPLWSILLVCTSRRCGTCERSMPQVEADEHCSCRGALSELRSMVRVGCWAYGHTPCVPHDFGVFVLGCILMRVSLSLWFSSLDFQRMYPVLFKQHKNPDGNISLALGYSQGSFHLRAAVVQRRGGDVVPVRSRVLVAPEQVVYPLVTALAVLRRIDVCLRAPGRCVTAAPPNCCWSRLWRLAPMLEKHTRWLSTPPVQIRVWLPGFVLGGASAA